MIRSSARRDCPTDPGRARSSPSLGAAPLPVLCQTLAAKSRVAPHGGISAALTARPRRKSSPSRQPPDGPSPKGQKKGRRRLGNDAKTPCAPIGDVDDKPLDVRVGQLTIVIEVTHRQRVGAGQSVQGLVAARI